MPTKKIPKATAKRIPLYHKTFHMLKEMGKNRVSSAELSDHIKIDSATIRRDFSYFGTLGRRGYGYDVNEMVSFFDKLLNQDQTISTAIVGVGNLGGALLKQNFSANTNARITCGFDVSEDVVNTLYNGVPVYHMDELEQRINFMDIEVVILTVPNDQAQEATDRLVDSGIKGILNFTSIRVDVPEDVRVHNVDLSNELQSLIYFMDYYDN